MVFVDAHTHINTDTLYSHRQDILIQFIQVGGGGLVNAWASDVYNTRWCEIAHQAHLLWYDIPVLASIGYHPDACVDGEIIADNLQQKILDLKKMYVDHKDVIVAIGECGIDTYYPGSEEFLPLQQQLFAAQCTLAQELWLPLMLHIRKDFESAFEILKKYSDMTVYIHCRGFGPEEVERLQVESWRLWRKLFIGFCGNVTYKNAQILRDSLAKVPLDQLLLETDAPRLSPQAVRGTTNVPANVQYIYDFVADYLQIEKNSLAEQLESNFKSLYKL